MIDTLDGADGSGRDHRTGTSPIFGSRSLPLASTLNRASAVNRIALPLILAGPEPRLAYLRSLAGAGAGGKVVPVGGCSGPPELAAARWRRPRSATPAPALPWLRSAWPIAARRWGTAPRPRERFSGRPGRRC